MANPIKILFSAMNSQGHVNQCLALAELLMTRGHQIVFALTKGWKPLVQKHGFEFIELETEKPKDENNNSDAVKKDIPPNQFLIEFVKSCLDELRRDIFENLNYIDEAKLASSIEFNRQMQILDEPLDKVIKEIKPDIVIIDIIMWLPCLMKSSVPWIQLWSSNPIIIYRDNCPPLGSGFPTNSDKKMWKSVEERYKKAYKPVHDVTVAWLASRGVEVKEENPSFTLFESPYMNIYNYPEVLDYNDIAPKPEKWFRVDSKVREPDEKTPFKIPDNLIDKPGKLIYFSLGSMGAVDVELMNRVIGVLAKSPHRFIVSKGPLHEQIQLADNMWGDRYVNQIAILPHVDLVITHGGNNTLTESLTFAKPMIVMPLFFDQKDNAQRVDEKKLGIRIDTYHFKDEELLNAIEKLLNDQELKEKLQKISEDLKKSTTREEVCQLIEKTAIEKKSNFV